MVDENTDVENEDLEIEIEDDDSVVATIEAKDDVNPNVADQLGKSATEGAQTLEERYAAMKEKDPELAEYHGKNVDKRIKKLTFKQREAERQSEEALTYAQGVLAKNTELENKIATQDGAFIGEHTTRLESQLQQAQQNYQDAYNVNDGEAIAKATSDIARVSAALGNAQGTKQRFDRQQESREHQPAPVYNPQPAAQPRPRPLIDPKTQAWAERNEWFGEDEEVTKAARAIHTSMEKDGQFIAGSTGYFTEMDKRLKQNFPEKDYWGAEVATTPATPAAVVTPVMNAVTTPRGKGRTVRLSASQRSVARKLGLTDEQYAKGVVDMGKQ